MATLNFNFQSDQIFSWIGSYWKEIDSPKLYQPKVIVEVEDPNPQFVSCQKAGYSGVYKY